MNQELINALINAINAINAQLQENDHLEFEDVYKKIEFGKVFRIKYVKKDGEEVERLGVIDQEFGFNSDGKKFDLSNILDQKINIFKYYDLMKDGWRCCHITSIKEITIDGVKYTF